MAGPTRFTPVTVELASRLAALPLACLQRDWPNKLDHVMASEADVASPRALHPAFYGCFDWHSAVHGHWMLARLAAVMPQLPEVGAIVTLFDATLTRANIAVEAAYFARPEAIAFERPYGWGWLLALATELRGTRWDIAPLARIVIERFTAFLPKQTYPVRTGVHANTAFALGLALDHARAVGDTAFERVIVERALAYYRSDTNAPLAYEPSGEDFLSPALVEADLMQRVLAPETFAAWLRAFLPAGFPLAPAQVSDRSDPKLAHLDGLNLSRAWCLRAIDPDASARHAEAGLAHVTSGDYAGEHWLASFATYLLTSAAGRRAGTA